jgi:hypothetical protein
LCDAKALGRFCLGEFLLLDVGNRVFRQADHTLVMPELLNSVCRSSTRQLLFDAQPLLVGN